MTYKPGRPSRQEPGHVAGEYRIKSKSSGEVKYIEETGDLARRKGEQRRSGKYNPSREHFEWKEAEGRSTSNSRRRHETEKIDQHQPRKNQRAGGGGRK